MYLEAFPWFNNACIRFVRLRFSRIKSSVPSVPSTPRASAPTMPPMIDAIEVDLDEEGEDEGGDE